MVWIKKQKTTPPISVTPTHTHKHTYTHRRVRARSLPKVVLHSPCKLDVLVDGASDRHGDDGVVPGAEEHQSETQAHPQERQSPAAQDTETEAG